MRCMAGMPMWLPFFFLLLLYTFKTEIRCSGGKCGLFTVFKIWITSIYYLYILLIYYLKFTFYIMLLCYYSFYLLFAYFFLLLLYF